MNRRIGVTAAMALWAGLGATGAQAAESCVTPVEASGLMLVLAPDAIKAAGTVCAQALPPTALLRQTSGPFIDKYQAEANAAWPTAKSAISKIAGDRDGAIDPEMLRPMLAIMVAPMISKGIKPADCGAIDHIMTLLAPLPPRNAAELVVTIVQMKGDKDKKGGKSAFDICPVARP